jgi:flavin reductase (DIM6/NTAB) family NADH-FMN oxidoreductase RutF
MDLPWGDEKTKQFITNIGLITTNGLNGNNIMSSEWTHHISYSPGLIMICIRPNTTTHENIQKTKEFGISISSTDQNILTSVSGTNSGKYVNKIKVLEEIGYKFYKADKINVLMVENAVLNFECKLIKEIALGSHTLFIGEILDIKYNKDKKPLAYHQGKFWKLTETIPKPEEKDLKNIKMLVEKYKK